MFLRSQIFIDSGEATLTEEENLLALPLSVFDRFQSLSSK